MNKFVFSALATTLIGATSFASETEWSELDSEMAAFTNAPLTQDAGGPYVNGWLIGALDYNSDSENAVNANDDQGFNIHGARINMSGSVGTSYGYVVGFDFTDTGEMYTMAAAGNSGGGTPGLTDAYGTFAIGEQVNGKIGVFRMPFLRSALLDRNKTIFIDRSYIGSQYSSRDAGMALGGSFSRINWDIAIQNGFDGNGEGWSYGGRLSMDIIGTSSNVEGGYNSAEGTNLNIGVGYQDDTSDQALGGSSADRTQLAIDAYLTMGGFSVWGEMVDQDNSVVVANPGGATPYSVGLGYLFGGNYEVAGRYDDHDDAFSTTRYTIGVNRYISGHDAKWQFQYSGGSSDATANEDSILSVGLALGF
jgi:Phosphate-selective porin O and P